MFISGLSCPLAYLSSFCSYCWDIWQIKHPSALHSFDCMMKASKGKKIVVFLDYDGTLSEIVDDPEQAFMSETMRAAVREVARQFPTAIISGRRRDKVYDFVKLNEIYYAGSHGMDILAPLRSSEFGDRKHQTRVTDEKGHEGVLYQPAQDFLSAIKEIIKALEEKTRSIEGAMIEDNKFCITVHFRHVADEDICYLEEQVLGIINDFPKFRLTRGKKVLEIRPSIDWDKGYAVEYLLETLGFDHSEDVLAIYIGDDKTDEDAFKVLRQRGQGFPIIVSSIPRETYATYSLRNPTEVKSFLLRLARWSRSSSSGKIVFED
ncbi:Trehalose-phosphatase [Dillenia turbinata]|uniref:Trehalose 6-phosphate phosphatase n=1 Tax=Dillenia turbinata TaxID=194707 RepID=A0AAN8UJZ5_9MAGN